MIRKNILVTGSAGFIGFHLCKALIEKGHNVVGLDNINDYYDVNLKYSRLNELGITRVMAESYNNLCVSKSYGKQMQFIRMNLEDREALPKLFEELYFDIVCNLAAQAGVRYSLENPYSYINSNINGFINILECCRHHNIKRLVYASSSSIYGNSKKVPFKETDSTNKPVSLYAATKKSNELMSYTYSYLYEIETIGLRFFTVYGPWGRPDMAMFLFTDAIINKKPLKVFNSGDLSRDFTYIDDIIRGVMCTILQDSKNKSLNKLYNIGNCKPVQLMDFIKSIENKLGVEAEKQMFPMQPGDVNKTWADVSLLQKDYDYFPNTSLSDGVNSFLDWYTKYYLAKD